MCLGVSRDFPGAARREAQALDGNRFDEALGAERTASAGAPSRVR